MTQTRLELITTPAASIPVYKIENFEELKQAVTLEMQKYQGLVYTDETIIEAKKDRARLNAFSNQLDKARIAQKKAALINQYEVFEKQCNELKELINKPLSAIDEQVKAFEEKQKAEKLEKVRNAYLNFFDEIKGIATLDLVLNEKWLNTTFSMKRVEEELELKAQTVRNDLAAIADACADQDIRKQALLVYSKDLILSNALMEARRLTEKAKQLEAEAKKLEEQRKAEIDKQNEPLRADFPQKNEPAENQQFTTETTVMTEDIKTVDFRVYATKSQLLTIREFLINAGIKYTAVFTQSERGLIKEALENELASAIEPDKTKALTALKERFI